MELLSVTHLNNKMETKRIISIVFAILIIFLLLSSTVLAQVNWLKESNGELYLAWDNGTKSEEIKNGDSAVLHSGYFFSTISDTVRMTVRLNSVATGQTVKILADKYVDVSQNMGYETITVNPADYNHHFGEYIIIVKLKDSNSELVDSSLFLKVKPKLLIPPGGIEIPFPIPNNPPFVLPIPNQDVDEEELLEFNVIGLDLDNDRLTYEYQRKLNFLNFQMWLPILPSGAEFIGNKFSFQPDYDFVDHPVIAQNIQMRFRANDAETSSNWEEVNIMVHDVNRIPEFVNQFETEVNEGELLEFDLVGEDLDDDQLYFLIQNSPYEVIFVDNGDNSATFSWTPGFDQAGIYEVTFIVHDGVFGGLTSKTINLTVNDVAVHIPQCNDGRDNDGDDLVDMRDPGCDSPEDDDEEDPEPVYQCNDNRDNDGDGLIDMRDPGCDSPQDDDETNEVEENHAPTAVNDAAETLENNAVTIAVLSNDYDLDGDNLFVSAVSQAENGLVEVINNEVKYTPNQDFIGIDYFKYSVSDGDLESTGYVTITVVEYNGPVYQCSDNLDNDNDGYVDYPADPDCDNPEDDNEWGYIEENHPPVALDDYAETVTGFLHLGVKVEIDVLANDFDPDNDVLEIISFTEAANGDVDFENGILVYNPEPFFVGEDTFTYTISDGTFEDTAIVTVLVKDNNEENQRPLVNDDYAETDEGKNVLIWVLDNDSDPDGDDLTIEFVTDPEHGSAQIMGNSDYIMYSPEPGFIGFDNFGYSVTDGNGNRGRAIVTVEVKELNEPVYQCSDNLDNDNDGLVDYPADPGCDSPQDDDEYNYLPPQPVETFSNNLVITSAQFAQEVVHTGDYALLAVNTDNRGNLDLEDVKISVIIYNLGLKVSTSQFDLDEGEDQAKIIYLPFPYDAQSGQYMVKITAGNDYHHTQTYRIITLN